MGKITSIYFRDDFEQEQVKLFLAALRSKENGLSAEQAQVAVNFAFGVQQPAKPSEPAKPAEPEKTEDAPKDYSKAPERYKHWVTEGNVPQEVLDETWMEYRAIFNGGVRVTMDELLREKGYVDKKPEEKKEVDPNTVMMGNQTLAEYLK